MPDVIKQEKNGRINTQGSLGSLNWEWRMADFKTVNRKLSVFTKLIKDSKRL